jgi:DNA-binding response OmpR family regulator
MSNILLVEDDSTLAFSIEYTLRGEGFTLEAATSLAEARAALGKGSFELVLLDVKLPDGSGYELCREIRKTGSLPVIFLTACDEEVNIVSGLDMGVDDYITKPFRIRELVSRIHAVLRRVGKREAKLEILTSGSLQVHTMEGKVRKNGEEVILTTLEYRLLLHFLSHPRQILSRNSILEGLWDIGGEFIDDNSLSVYIRRLREKIEDDPAEPRLIVTVRGMGYKWDAEVMG